MTCILSFGSMYDAAGMMKGPHARDRYTTLYAPQGPMSLADSITKTNNRIIRGQILECYEIPPDGHCGCTALALGMVGKADMTVGSEVKWLRTYC